MSEHGVADLVQDAPASGATVRRHHTISSSSRLGRGDGARTVVPENTQLSHEDEVVDDDWVGPIGAVGEGSAGLHRQTSLPTRYHRGMLPSHERAYRTQSYLTTDRIWWVRKRTKAYAKSQQPLGNCGS